MKIGFTYDLRSDYAEQGYNEEAFAEFDSPETIDAIEAALRGLGHEVDRIGNIYRLTRLLSADVRWDLVYNSAAGMHGFGREAQVPALLDAYNIPYTFSDPLVLTLALHKGTAKTLVRSMGLPTPEFAVLRHEDDIYHAQFSWPVFAKPIAGGSSAGIDRFSIAQNRSELVRACRDLLQRFRQPVLVEGLLAGREFTVGVIGTGPRARVLGTMEIMLRDNAQPGVYSYSNKKNYLTRVSYRLVRDKAAQAAERMALHIWRKLGGRDAGRLDFRCDRDGTPNFLELNPLPGLHPVDSDLVILARLLGISHSSLIENIVASACERLPVRQNESAYPSDHQTVARSHPRELTV